MPFTFGFGVGPFRYYHPLGRRKPRKKYAFTTRRRPARTTRTVQHTGRSSRWTSPAYWIFGLAIIELTVWAAIYLVIGTVQLITYLVTLSRDRKLTRDRDEHPGMEQRREDQNATVERLTQSSIHSALDQLK